MSYFFYYRNNKPVIFSAQIAGEHSGLVSGRFFARSGSVTMEIHPNVKDLYPPSVSNLNVLANTSALNRQQHIFHPVSDLDLLPVSSVMINEWNPSTNTRLPFSCNREGFVVNVTDSERQNFTFPFCCGSLASCIVLH